ncbi:uncharacterized protein LOC129609241 [Condylostylus longicornis]|uniref:uncharacterized protein LOC129609241 n=1 Tax=Condylostylus longicornis TaxID=2530218 RepID=UPI00244E2036|nr:uncharacterized protein LOC129609241 [Condylostylus longicornis]
MGNIVLPDNKNNIECILEPIGNENRENSEINNSCYQEHIPCSIGFYMKTSFPSSYNVYNSYRGEDCINWFMNELDLIATLISSDIVSPVKMNLTSDDHFNFIQARTCHICEQEFVNDDKNNYKVRDHCHFTGQYRGAAHNMCNLRYVDDLCIPIIFHNLSSYDSHFLIKEIVDLSNRISVVPKNKEKYTAFTVLVNNYLLKRKSVYPYDYISNFDKFFEEKLPEKHCFYNKLNKSNISDNDYLHAQNVWREFEIRNLGDYSDLYLKTDVLLLADIFENFRVSSLNAHKLDPAHYITIPSYTWDAMLKFTNVKLELLTDIDMLLFIERGIRGGLTQVSKRHSIANNPYLPEYDSSVPNKYLMYWDINNQYGYAMSQFLPTGNFKWVKDIKIFTENFITSIQDDSPTGYFFEVDLQYPKELHDLHSDIPFCCQSMTINNSNQKKLVATLYDKEKYVIHYRALKQALLFGLKLKHIHAVLEFSQSDFNTKLRAASTNDFDSSRFKLYNNGCYGKSMENTRKYARVKLATQWGGRYGAKSLIASPYFKNCTIFNENLIAVELNNAEIYYSLIYEIYCDDIYNHIKNDCIMRLDTSDYPKNDIWNIPYVNKKVLGMMKDELNDKFVQQNLIKSEKHNVKTITQSKLALNASDDK